MTRRTGGDLAVGALFALALLILALAVMAVGAESRLFSRKADFEVVFPQTDGLSVGSPVKMAGVQIGTVTHIRLPTDPGQTGIEVRIGVDRAFVGRVREDSRAALRILQYLTGEKSVDILPGSPELPALPEGSTIELQQDRELLAQVGEASQNLNDITISLKSILGALESGEGLIGQMITDPAFGRESIDALHGTLTNLQALTADLREGRGLVGRLLYDERFATRLDDLGQALEDAARLVASLRLDQGAVGALLAEGGAGEQAVTDLRDGAAALKRVAERLEAGEGFLGSLLEDGEYSRRLARDLELTLANLAEISRKLNDGEGTLGALLNDPMIYEGMGDVVGGVNDSKFARWLLRHYRKKGVKTAPDEE